LKLSCVEYRIAARKQQGSSIYFVGSYKKYISKKSIYVAKHHQLACPHPKINVDS